MYRYPYSQFRAFWSLLDCTSDHSRDQIKEKTIARTAGVIVSLLVASVLAVGSIQAASGIRIEPLYLELTLSEGDTSVSGDIILQNQTSNTQQVDFSALDIKSEDANGNVQFVGSVGGNDTAAVSYVKLSTSSAVLAPGESFRLQVTVANTQELSPGGHYSAVVARFLAQDAVSNQTQVQPAVSTLLLTRKIGGERYHISLSSIAGSESFFHFKLPTHFDLTFVNDGNIHVVPYGTIELFDLFGRRVKKGIINEGSAIVLPQNRRTLPQDLYAVSRSFPMMIYSVVVSGSTTPGDVPYSRQFSFIYISQAGLVGLIVCIAVMIIILVRIRRQKRV